MRDLEALYRVYRRQGVPIGQVEFVKIEQRLLELLQLGESDLTQFLSANRGDAVEMLRRVLKWLSDNQQTGDDLALPELNALVGLANLRSIVELWNRNVNNDDEEFWQDKLARYSFVLSQIFAYPVVVIQGKAYVGGKRLDNVHGNIVDFLAQVPSSGEAVLIEIKTPAKPLLGPRYRQDVYPPSRELVGAVAQILQYRESLMHELHTLNAGHEPSLLGADPRCIVVIGNAQRDLEDLGRRRSFERFRERLTGVTIVTYDELFARTDNLIALLEQTQSSQSG